MGARGAPIGVGTGAAIGPGMPPATGPPTGLGFSREPQCWQNANPVGVWPPHDEHTRVAAGGATAGAARGGDPATAAGAGSA
jgi:hypothetical protein